MYCPHCGKSIPEGSAFCPGCGKPASGAQAAPKKSRLFDSALRIFGAVAGIILGLILLGAYLNSRKSAGPNRALNPIGAILQQPVTQKVFSGQMVVAARQYRYWTITITPQMTNAQLNGSFHAVGGTGNDIQAVIADQLEFENWKNGHQARVYYSTQPTTNGQFNVRLPPGTYVLAFSNAFSILSDKEVTADIELHYLR
jgi:predicted nucleic acid-binding Zn ribbon protein